MGILDQIKAESLTGNSPDNSTEISNDTVFFTDDTYTLASELSVPFESPDASFAVSPPASKNTTTTKVSSDDSFFDVTASTTGKAKESTEPPSVERVKIKMTGSNLPFRSEMHSTEPSEMNPVVKPKPVNIADVDPQAHERSELDKRGINAVWTNAFANNPEGFEHCAITCGALNKPANVQVLQVTPENPVLLGFKEGLPVNATSGFLVKEPGDRLSYMTEKEFKEKADDAEEIKNKEGMRGGTLLSAILKTPIAAFKSAFNAGMDLAKDHYDKDHLSKFREQKLARTANSASNHLNRATELTNSVLKDEKIAPLVRKLDAIDLKSQSAVNNGNDVNWEELRNQAKGKIQETISSNPDLSSKFTEALNETNLAAQKHNKFLMDAEKSNLSPDKLIQMDQVDSQSIEKLKKMLEKTGTDNSSKAMENLDKMVEDIRSSVKKMVDKFQNMFGAKNG